MITDDSAQTRKQTSLTAVLMEQLHGKHGEMQCLQKAEGN